MRTQNQQDTTQGAALEALGVSPRAAGHWRAARVFRSIKARAEALELHHGADALGRAEAILDVMCD